MLPGVCMDDSLLNVIRQRSQAVHEGVERVITKVPISTNDPNAGVDSFARAQALAGARAEERKRKDQHQGKKGKYSKGGKDSYKGSGKAGNDGENEKSAYWLFIDVRS